ncbi:DUF6602 domain-containing protein [Enterococcus sp. CWB-B31]|uniref:DUF6602 domain-containing protein n=1 Tax=Enterococcus sp. CWB-B31 TaxID=2885159 RepID=UPI001E3937F4|nr:DUF6602 domain-containing protein [Enterococcus sp. CWB-B31]MCB5953977.1 hypothetical protein [Enterococcus sp. CWB-B31]
MTSIKALLGNKQKTLIAKLEADLNHPTSKGDNSEEAWINFFRSFLPSKYAVDKGFIFDSTGNMSEQIDVIIYDSLYTPLIFETEAGEKFITSESVYAIFEVKQEINRSYLEYAHKKIMSVRTLYRSSRSMIVAGKQVPARGLTKILGGILSSRTVAIDTLKTNLSEFSSIDLGCAINHFSFLTIKNEDNKTIDVIKSSADETVLSFFFIILDELYKLGTSPAVDIRDYADFSLDSIQLKREV